MTMYLFYCGLLVLWVLLLWPVFRLKGRARLWLIVVIAAAIAALVYETRMYLWSHAAIRLDIPLISIALVCLYASASVLLFVKCRWATATLLAGVLVVIGGVMINEWSEAGHESQRVRAAFNESNRLLFTAKFRSPEAYERYFGPLDGAGDRAGDAAANHPIGHWQVEERSQFTRLIINAEGEVWLFYQCQEDAECHYGSQGSGLDPSGDNPRQWQAGLKPPVGLPVDVKITQSDSGSLSVALGERTIQFAKAPPPVGLRSGPQSLRYLGSFAEVGCLGAHATIRQVWLWQDDARGYAVGIFSTLVAGRQNHFVTPVLMGEGVRQDNGWRFVWQRDGRYGTALIALGGSDAILTLDQDGRDLEDADHVLLKGGAVFSDERIELAPLTTAADWHHWFDNVLVGHFASGFVPAC